MSVLDASAILALIKDEPGAAIVGEQLDGGWLSTANLAEVVGKLIDGGADARRAVDLLAAAGVVIVPLSLEDAVLAGSLRTIAGGTALSLGDRCCLALGLRSDPAVVITADRAWAELDLPVEVVLVR